MNDCSLVNELVSEVIGLKTGSLLGTGQKFVRDVPRDWSPATNLNDAFWAANRVALFENHALLFDDGRWSVNQAFEVHGEITEGNLPQGTADGWAAFIPGMGLVSKAYTPALAICEAILELKEKA